MKQIPEEFAQWSTISIIVQQIANKAIGMGSCKHLANIAEMLCKANSIGIC